MTADLNLLPPVLEIIQRVKEVSGKDVIFRPAPGSACPRHQQDRQGQNAFPHNQVPTADGP